jgi:hypothetical protein
MTPVMALLVLAGIIGGIIGGLWYASQSRWVDYPVYRAMITPDHDVPSLIPDPHIDQEYRA